MKIPLRLIENSRSNAGQFMAEIKQLEKKLGTPPNVYEICWHTFRTKSTVTKKAKIMWEEGYLDRFKKDGVFVYTVPEFDEPTVEVDEEIMLKSTALAAYVYSQLDEEEYTYGEMLEKFYQMTYHLELMVRLGYISYTGTVGKRKYRKEV